MALKKQSRSRVWSRLHFLVRFAGLSGLLAAGAGVALAFFKDLLSWERLTSVNFIRSVFQTREFDLPAQIAVGLLLGGVLLAAVALAVEVLAALVVVTGRRSAFGFNAALQVALLIALVIGVNVYSYRHYLRLDWTQDQAFTLPADIREQLLKLKDATTIVVYQRHKTFGQLADKPDAYDYAAERKVVEKVKDLVEQFRELGPRFQVVALDVEEDGFNNRLDALTQNNKKLREAIDRAPENSIFFAAGENVQRLSFNDFYELDKTASRAADGGRGNLVLLQQGVDAFARKVLNIDARRPKVGVLVIHELLTTLGPEDLGLAGLRKTLVERGFDVKDVILKKWSEIAPPEPAVYTYDESKNDRLEEELASVDADIKGIEEDLKSLNKAHALWKSSKLEDLTKRYASQLGGRKVDERLRRAQLAFFEQNQGILSAVLKQYREDRQATAREKSRLNVENIAEERRMTDLKAKLARSIADCDLLIIPRMTIRNAIIGDRIPNQVHRLDDAQVAAIKDFIKSGKPVLACLGPASEQPGDEMRLAQLGPPGSDGFENLLAELGIKFGNQTVLFNVESKAFAERRSGLMVSTESVEVPPVDFDAHARIPGSLPAEGPAPPANPIRSSMRITAHSLGKTLDLRLRYPRPVYYQAPAGAKPAFDPQFMVTSAASWNEKQPFPSRERIPRYEPAKPEDPTRGTLDEERRGPFPVGIAIETRLPAGWSSEAQAPARNVRVAAMGSGSVFTGATLTPAREELLLITCNWLLGRDDLLPRATQVWQYPRVALDSREHTLWHWGTWVGLPALFAYFGIVVLLVRRLR